jgi:putative endonuclease
MAMPWFVYILECANGALYVGSTEDVEKRFIRHVAGNASDFTRRHCPIRILFREEYPTLEAAVRRERQLKGWKKAKKLALAAGNVSRVKQLARSHSSASEIPFEPPFDRLRAPFASPQAGPP